MNRRSLILLGLGLLALVIVFLSRKANLNPEQQGVLSLKSGASASSGKLDAARQPATALPEPGHKTNGPRHEELRPGTTQFRQEIENEVALWQTSIIYYGKVIDENDQPIVGARAAYGANTLGPSLEEVYKTGSVTSDERGFFKIEGVKGIGLMIEVSHPEYYAYPTNSTGFDKRTVPRKGYFSDSEANAEIFRMHSKSHPVPLVHRRGGADVPVNMGNAVVEFYGREEKQTVGKLQIEAWGDTPKNFSRNPYDWSVRLTIPDGGGLIEFTNQFDFVAPENGYASSIEIVMAKENQNWSDTVDKSYFLKFPIGYARMGIHMRAKTPLYISLDYHFNPDGSRNLEPTEK